MPYELLIFDCDGVLVDSEPLSNRIFSEELHRIGLPMTCRVRMSGAHGSSRRDPRHCTIIR